MTRLTSVDPRLNADCDGLAREGLDGDQSIPTDAFLGQSFES